MPLTDADDCKWAIDRLEVFIARMQGLKLAIRGAVSGLDRTPEFRSQVQRLEVVTLKIFEQTLPDAPTYMDLDSARNRDWMIDAANRSIGVLENLRDIDLRLSASGPSLSGADLHDVVWTAARKLCLDGHFGEAVNAAAAMVNIQLQVKANRSDISDAQLVREVFSEKSPEPGKPRLRWPGDPANQTVKSMNDGIRDFARGVFLAIRNPAAHGTVSLDATQAMERLAALSGLMNWIDECQIEATD